MHEIKNSQSTSTVSSHKLQADKKQLFGSAVHLILIEYHEITADGTIRKSSKDDSLMKMV